MTVTPLRRSAGADDDQVDQIARRYARLLARMAAGNIELREATSELYDIHNRMTVAATRAATEDLPGNVADAAVIAAATHAILECEIDRMASEPVLAVAERRLGEVLVLPCGRSVGAKPKPAPMVETDQW